MTGGRVGLGASLMFLSDIMACGLSDKGLCLVEAVEGVGKVGREDRVGEPRGHVPDGEGGVVTKHGGKWRGLSNAVYGRVVRDL
jgi:hypothetical protein